LEATLPEVKVCKIGNKLFLASIFHFRGETCVQVPIIASTSSARGIISSILCPKFGGYLTFGSLAARKESALGQPALTDLINIYRIKNLGKDTKVFGIIENPVGQSKGPILHNQAFREIGLDAVYVPFLVDDLPDFLRVYSSSDFAGFRCTFFLLRIMIKI
jgi:3-dehydroquinate dehydratase/shikimate dehydrogenase